MNLPKKFVHKTFIGLRESDATGVLFFADQFKLVMETFEAFLRKSGYSLKSILSGQEFYIPVVHAESDYFGPLRVGDEIEITLNISHIGNSSFTCSYELFDPHRQLLVGKSSLVHVAVSAETRKSIPIPESLHKILK